MPSEISIQFYAGVHSIETGEEKRVATFYIMNTSMNRNRWGVTEKALSEASPTLLGKTLGIDRDYQVQGHPTDEQLLQAGTFNIVDDSNVHYLLGGAEIIDAKTWELLEAGKIGPISVKITAFQGRCSHCWAQLDIKDPFKHECIASGDGYTLIESFVFDRVDFVDRGAFPQAGTLEIQQLASLFTASQSTVRSTDGRLQGAFKPDEKEENKLSEYEKLQADVTSLSAQFKELLAKLDKEPEKDPGLTELEAQFKEMKDEQHLTRVMATLEARVSAGLVEDRDAELEKLKGLEAAALVTMENDAKMIASRAKELQAQAQAMPITQYTPEVKTQLEASMEAYRLQMFGHKESLNAGVV